MAMASFLFLPFDAEVWKQAVYSYDKADGVGLYKKTDKATVFAPEAGKFTDFGDGSWGLEVEGGTETRTWIGVSAVNGLPPTGPVFAGQPLGTSVGDFKMSLAVLPKGAGAAARPEDPTVYLIKERAEFPEFQGPTKNKPRDAQERDVAAIQQREASHAQSKSQMALRPATDPRFDPNKRHFTAGQLAVGMVGMGLVGFLVAKGLSSR